MVAQSNSVPAWLSGQLSAADKTRAEEAIQKAEVGTRGEVVVAVVKRSACFGHVFPLLALSFFSLFLMLAHEPLWFAKVGNHGAIAIAVAGVVALALAWPLSRLLFFRRLLTAAEDQWLQARERAELEFYAAGLHKTRERSGVMIFISYTEHQVFVLADEGIASKLPESTWAEVTALVTGGLRNHRFGEGLQQAVGRCGQILASHFPPAADNPNELKDHLIIKD